MSYIFHPQAEDGSNDAVEYYEEISTGLDFAEKVASSINRTVNFPQAWPILDSPIRRSLLNWFPYGVLYSDQTVTIFIIAIMNLHRAPGCWKHRS